MFSHLRLLTDLSERANAALPSTRALASACDTNICLCYSSDSHKVRAKAARVLASLSDERWPPTRALGPPGAVCSTIPRDQASPDDVCSTITRDGAPPNDACPTLNDESGPPSRVCSTIPRDRAPSGAVCSTIPRDRASLGGACSTISSSSLTLNAASETNAADR